MSQATRKWFLSQLFEDVADTLAVMRVCLAVTAEVDHREPVFLDNRNLGGGVVDDDLAVREGDIDEGNPRRIQRLLRRTA